MQKCYVEVWCLKSEVEGSNELFELDASTILRLASGVRTNHLEPASIYTQGARSQDNFAYLVEIVKRLE